MCNWQRARFCNGAYYILIHCSLKAIKDRPDEAWHDAIERRFGGRRPGSLRSPGLAGQSHVAIMLAILALGVAPARVLNTLSTAVASLNPPAPNSAVAQTSR